MNLSSEFNLEKRWEKQRDVNGNDVCGTTDHSETFVTAKSSSRSPKKFVGDLWYPRWQEKRHEEQDLAITAVLICIQKKRQASQIHFSWKFHSWNFTAKLWWPSNPVSFHPLRDCLMLDWPHGRAQSPKCFTHVSEAGHPTDWMLITYNWPFLHGSKVQTNRDGFGNNLSIIVEYTCKIALWRCS